MTTVPLCFNCVLTATGTGSSAVRVSKTGTIADCLLNGQTQDLLVTDGATAQVNGNAYDVTTLQGSGIIDPFLGDRAAWDVLGYPDRHADDISTNAYTYHLAPGQAANLHVPVTLAGGSDPALTLSGQQLSLADVLTPTEHTAIGNSSPHHAPVTLDPASDTHLHLTGQVLKLDPIATGTHIEVVMSGLIPADPVLTPSGDDWVYAYVPD